MTIAELPSIAAEPRAIVELVSGPARLRLAPSLGGRITALRLASAGNIAARDILAPFPESTRQDELLHWPKGGLYPLVPYSNRIRNGQLLFLGRRYAIPSHPDGGAHSLHGHAHRAAWHLADRGADFAAWFHVHLGGGEWPWHFRADMAAQLSPHELRLKLALRNEDASPMPAGFGFHPYFNAGPSDRIRFKTTTDWPITSDFLAGPSVALPTSDAALLPPNAVTLYRSGWAGTCELLYETGERLLLRADPVFDHFVAHRPEGSSYVCLEPVTHVADGFNMAERGCPGTGRKILEPGETLAGEIRLSLRAEANTAPMMLGT